MNQRITVAKVAGSAAGFIVARLRAWAGEWLATEPTVWSSEQWPPPVRRQVDRLATLLRANGMAPPVVYYVEWVDPWSMFHVFHEWLTPPGRPVPLTVHEDRFEVYGYALPDGGQLARHLESAGPFQFAETRWLVTRLREALGALQSLIGQSLLVVLREVIGGSFTDEEMTESLGRLPAWLSDIKEEDA